MGMVHIDRQIAIWAGWIAGPAFGVAMMAAPEYLKLDPPYSGFLFWGGLIIFFVTIIVVVALSLHDDRVKKKVVGPILTMALGTLILGGGIAWYFWPQTKALTQAAQSTEESARTVSVEMKPWKHTLEDLYKLDFSNLLKLGSVLNTVVINKQSGERKEIQLNISIMQDFQSQVDFISIYIPDQNIVWVQLLIYNIIHDLVDQIKPIRDKITSDIGTGTSFPGSQYVSSHDLSFSGKVYFYTLAPFSIIQLGELASWYREKNLFLEIRGNDYWWAQKDR